MRKIKLTRANKSILLKALAPYYYREKALGHSTEKPGRLILRLGKGQYTDAADDMLLKLF